MPYFTYILYSPSSGHCYVGFTPDLERRLNEHNFLGKSSYTSKFRPWRILASIEFSSRSAAMKAEKYLKKKPRDFLQRLESDIDLRKYIKSKFEAG